MTGLTSSDLLPRQAEAFRDIELVWIREHRKLERTIALCEAPSFRKISAKVSPTFRCKVQVELVLE